MILWSENHVFSLQCFSTVKTTFSVKYKAQTIKYIAYAVSLIFEKGFCSILFMYSSWVAILQGHKQVMRSTPGIARGVGVHGNKLVLFSFDEWRSQRISTTKVLQKYSASVFCLLKKSDK